MSLARFEADFERDLGELDECAVELSRRVATGCHGRRYEGLVVSC